MAAEKTGTPYQVMPALEPAEQEALRRSIEEIGVTVPVIVDEAGTIIDGHHRAAICAELGLEYPTQTIFADDLPDTDKRELARSLNCQRRQLTTAQKRVVIADQLRDSPEYSDRRIAEIVGVSHRTVAVVRQELEATGQIVQLKERRGQDGKTRKQQPAGGARKPAPSEPPPSPPADSVEENPQQHQAQSESDPAGPSPVMERHLAAVQQIIDDHRAGDLETTELMMVYQKLMQYMPQTGMMA